MRALLIAAALTIAAAPAAAQNRQAARVAYDEAERQFQAGNYQLAIESFQRAYDAMAGDPVAQVQIVYNIGLAQEGLGRWADALASFERYLAQAPAGSPNREATLDRVRELRGRLAASGQNGQSGGGTSVLVPVGIAVAAAGGAALIASIVTGVLALDGESQLSSMCPDGACPGSARGLLDETYALGTTTDVLWIAGASLAAIGGALLIVGITSGGESAPVAAACTEDGCVATVQGTF